ncbi:fasciclin domain-containing protein [Microbulbifer agarilyticus]|uniref:fasciclin domain-containing protein n=1 Tax=Microbulbifer agarilyticus TaxID=260552 RepID=UPI001C95FB67|nr:fasciclin domain-containing protein [Microbulbifer agarilyticus]MBY6211468.1 fasciclin domain-containing protein [Microbulbifer agarilyticus]
MQSVNAVLTKFFFAPLILTALACMPLKADESKTIAENAANAEALSTLVAAVKAAELVDTLKGDGPFTVFAPTNDAFAALPAGTVEMLLKPENKEKLKKILTYHVVPSKATAEMVVGLIKQGGGHAKVKTVEGDELTLKMMGDKVTITDAKGNTVNVVQADIMNSNGVVHVIDGVLMPSK